MSYYVSRQHYYYSGEYAVEVAAGGLDYSGCDMLATTDPAMRQLEGEYNNPKEAMESAIKLVQLWQSKPFIISLCYGHNMDMIEGETIPSAGLLDGGEEYSDEEMDIIRFDEARAWAEKEYNSLDKCAKCGEILPDKRNRFTLIDNMDDEEFCSEYCAESAWDFMFCEDEELEDENDN